MLEAGTDTAYGPLASGTLRVLSWNLWWRFGPWEERLPAILAAIEALDPDVVCLQEVWTDPDGDSSAARVADRLGGFHQIGSSRLVVDGVSFGNAVVARWPITGSATLDLPVPSPATEELRTCLRADVATPWGEVQVYCTHLNWRFDESHVRQEQVRAICRFVCEAPDRTYPPVLCGDFNAVPDSDEIRMLTGRAAVPEERLVFHDAWEVAGDLTGGGGPGFTWSNDNPFARLDLEPSRRIDYVFAGWPKAGGRGHVESVRVVGTEPVGGIVPSDHYGVLAELRI